MAGTTSFGGTGGTLLPNEMLSAMAIASRKEAISLTRTPLPFYDAMDASKDKPRKGGVLELISWEFGEHSRTTRMSNGWEPIDRTARPLTEPGRWGWMHVMRPVLISGQERLENRGDAAFDIVSRRTKDTIWRLQKQANDAWLLGNVPEWADSESIDGFSASTGFLESNAVGAQTNVIHSVGRTTHRVPGFQNQVYNATNSFSANGFLGMYTVNTKVRRLTQIGKNPENKRATNVRLYGSENGIINVKRAANVSELYVGKDPIDPGREVEFFGKHPLEECDLPSTWTFAWIDHNAIKVVPMDGAYFEMSQFKDVDGYDVTAAMHRVMCQLVGTYFGACGVLYNGDTFA